MKIQSDDGIYPIHPGQTVKLGDFGYIDSNGSWRCLGNIENIPGYEIFLHKSVSNVAHEVVISHGVSVTAEASAKANAADVGAGCKLSFKSDNNFYVKGTITSAIRYDSLEFEVKDCLERLKNNKIWKPKYRLVTEVLSSPRFLAVFSRQKGILVEFNDDISAEVPTPQIEIGAEVNAGTNLTGLEIVNKTKNSDISPIGFKLVKIEKGNIFSRRHQVRYDADGNMTEESFDDDIDGVWVTD